MLSQGRISSKFLMHTEFRMKPNFRIRFDISMKSTCNFKIRFDFGFKPNFSIKPVLKRDSIQLYSRQQDEEVFGQVYHQHPMLHTVNIMASVYSWCLLSIP